MTPDEFKLVFDHYLDRAFANRITIKTYRAAAHRLVLRLPPESWNDGEAVNLYRISLSATMRAKLGSVLHHIGESVKDHGIEIVDYASVRHAFSPPSIFSDAVDVLSVAFSFDRLSTMTWADVPAILGTLGDRERGRLMSVLDYVWGEAEPDPAFPVIPLTRRLRQIPMPPDMAEAVVTHLSSGWTGAEERIAFDTYLAMTDAERPLAEVEEVMGWFVQTAENATRYDRPKAFSVAGKALADLRRGDLREFVAKWNAVLLRVDKKELDPDDRYRWFRETAPPAVGEPATVSVGPVEIEAGDIEDAEPRRFGTMSDPEETMPEWRKALKASNEWLHKVIAKS
jgi:hypothetical protein